MPDNVAMMATGMQILDVEGGEAAGGTIAIGDCLTVAKSFASCSLDLVYIDPPYFTKRNHVGKARQGGGEGDFAFADNGWESRKGYLEWLEPRLREFVRLLRPTGSLAVHLDWHAVHYVKVMLDEMLGDERFENELIWYYQTGGASKGRFSRKHDTILIYSVSEAFYFDGKAIAIPRTEKAMKRARSGKGARIGADDTHKNPDDVLLVPALNPMSKERTGYPTQKPVELLERLILALTPKEGTVGDFFCGSGTTLVAAQRLGRKWVGCDQSAAAVKLAKKRLDAAHGG